jgi:ribosomal silencing factor RsfS
LDPWANTKYWVKNYLVIFSLNESSPFTAIATACAEVKKTCVKVKKREVKEMERWVCVWLESR